MFRHKKSARKGEFPALQRGGLNILLLPEMLLFSVRRGEEAVRRDEGSVHRDEVPCTGVRIPCTRKTQKYEQKALGTVVIENKSICTVEKEE